MENKIEFYLNHKIETSDLIEQYRKLNSLIINYEVVQMLIRVLIFLGIILILGIVIGMLIGIMIGERR